ncbi:uncharacterized protein LAESUDRAFT_608864, partial [Laetiporus sulphureus 93-53]
YKKVTNQVKPIATTLPEEFRIMRRKPSDPFEGLPVLPTHLAEYVPWGRYTREWCEALDILGSDFLWPEEAKLVDFLMCIHNKTFAWDESEKGQFWEEYFDPVIILTVEHVPWVLRNMPIPP